MSVKRILECVSASVLMMSSVLTIAIPSVHAAGLTCTWTGAGADTKFSTAANWSGCSGASNPASVPVAGDSISFPQAATSNYTVVNLINDLGVTLGGVLSVGGANYSSYNIDTIALAPGAALDITKATVCLAEFPRISYGILTDSGSLTVNTDGADLDNTALTIGGNVRLVNSFGLGYLNAKTGSSVSGNVIVASPSADTTATGCSTAIGNGAAHNSGSSMSGFTINGLTVENGASVDLVNVAFPLTLGGGTGTTAPFVGFYGAVDTQTNYVDTTYTVTGAVTLLHDAQIYAVDKTTVNVTGAISGANFAITNDPTTTGKININSSANTSKTASGALVNAVKTTIISDDQSVKNFNVVPNETLQVDGKAGSIYLYAGATLDGSNGQIAGLYADTGSTVAPGHSPGCITSTSDVSIFGTYKVDVAGTTPCTGYDQLSVTGTVTLSDTFGNAGTLTAAPFNGYLPKVGEAYTIINNDAVDAVVGTFSGLAEGSTYTNAGVTYKVTYKGGDGNDVVLTVTKVDAAAVPAKPDTGFMLVAAHPIASFLTSSIAAAALIFASRKLRVNTK